MKKMILWTLVLFAPLMWTTSVQAIFGIPDVAALAQRVTIIANQGIQIANSVTQINKITEQFDKLKEQYEHIQEATLGHVGALTRPFTELAAIPGHLVSDGLAWRDDFTNPKAAELVDAIELLSSSGTPLTDYWRDRLNQAPVVTEADVIAEYATMPVPLAAQAAENYRRQRDAAEQRTVFSHTVNTAASSASATVISARESYEHLRAQTNKSDTALREAQVTSLITNGEVSAALLQLQTHAATEAAAKALAAEERRRERDAARLATHRAAQAEHAARVAGIASRADGGDRLRFRVQ